MILTKNKQTIIIILLVLVSIGSIFIGWQKQHNYSELKQSTEQKARLVNFLDLFIEKVLGPGEVITIEDRVNLENAVRDLENQEIQSKWQSFAKAPNEIEAQKQALELLQLVVNSLR